MQYSDERASLDSRVLDAIPEGGACYAGPARWGVTHLERAPTVLRRAKLQMI